ncbi:MAG TPA: GNAT family N-acetyltransferase [Micromonosporaceae bacterium]|nr:GNAT family N-acetyltransferase [Micromonosporaceae bacterium]
MTDDELPLRTATPDDWAAISRLLYAAFNETSSEEQDEVDRQTFEPDRFLVVTEGAEIVGTAGAFTRDLTVPGAVVPAAHVTQVGVAATHRRRGLLRRMMVRQLRDVRAAGEPLALLWASEGRIYQRFGYGQAAPKLSLEVDTREVQLRPTTPAGGRLRAADPASVRNELAKVYEQVRADRPGYSSRDERWWTYLLADVASRREGRTERRAVLHEGPAGVDGYALWRAKASWDAAGPQGEVHVVEVIAATLEAYVALWRFLLSVDLTRTARFWFAALDEPLVHLVDEPRRLGARFGDGLWVRIIDVATALAARRYAAGLDMVLEVTDELLPENTGRWRLAAGASGVRCRRTGDPADLACDIAALGAVYLGGTSMGSLAAAGRVRELRPGALASASTAFGWHRAPSAIEIF